MSSIQTILFKSLVKPFYRQHAGLFIFFFIILFGAVGRVDNAGLIEFHFSLVQGMLNNIFLFGLVFFAWLLYAKKIEQFIINTLRRPDFSFLGSLSLLDDKKLYWQLVWVQFIVLLPVSFYIVILFTIGIYLGAYFSCGFILFYIITLCLVPARWYMYIIQNPGKRLQPTPGKFFLSAGRTPYWTIFIRYISINKKLLFTGIKLYSCSILCLMVVNQTKVEYDLSMTLLFFSLGILGHGLLIHQLRNLEETRLVFYRSMPQSLNKRFMQYGIVYFILLLPEIITIAFLTPAYLHFKDALIFVSLSYSILLFLNSLLFIQFFRMKDYLKIILCVFLVIYFCVLSVSIPLLCILLFISSTLIFFGSYYQFEH